VQKFELILITALTSIFFLFFTNSISVEGASTAEAKIPKGASQEGGNHFEPQTLKIGKGTTVKWKNEDDTIHTVTSGTPSSGKSGIQFDSSYLSEGKTYEHTFKKTGTFKYYCTLHSYMTAKIDVSKSSPPEIPEIKTAEKELKPVVPEKGGALNSTFTKNVSTAYLNYNDKEIGFTIPYPSDWTIHKGNTNYKDYNNVAGFDSPGEEASVYVKVLPSSGYSSIKDYGDKTFKESQEQTLLQYYRNSTTLLGGKPAVKAIYLIPAVMGESPTLKAMMVATLVPEEKSIYEIAYFSNPQRFNDFRPVIEKMIDSFQMYGKGPVIQEDNSSSSNP
jgi:plastocyanin